MPGASSRKHRVRSRRDVVTLARGGAKHVVERVTQLAAATQPTSGRAQATRLRRRRHDAPASQRLAAPQRCASGCGAWAPDRYSRLRRPAPRRGTLPQKRQRQSLGLARRDRDTGAHRIPEVLVDLTGFDPAALPYVVDVLEEPLSGKLLTAAHDPRQALVVDDDLMLGSAFAPEAEQQSPGANESHVPVAQRGEA